MSYTYPEKFIRDGVIAPFLLLSVAIVRLPLGDCVHHCAADRLTDCIMSWQVLSLIRPVAFISSHYCNSTDFAMFLPPPHTHTHTHALSFRMPRCFSKLCSHKLFVHSHTIANDKQPVN